jgi:hypothetical protein
VTPPARVIYRICQPCLKASKAAQTFQKAARATPNGRRNAQALMVLGARTNSGGNAQFCVLKACGLERTCLCCICFILTVTFPILYRPSSTLAHKQRRQANVSRASFCLTLFVLSFLEPVLSNALLEAKLCVTRHCTTAPGILTTWPKANRHENMQASIFNVL